MTRTGPAKRPGGLSLASTPLGPMSPHGIPLEPQTLRENARGARVFYEVLPMLACQPPDTPVDWFEIALHAEADMDRPLDCPESREAVSLLKALADFLTQRVPPDDSCKLNVSCWYYTAHAPAEGAPPSATRVFRSVSITLSNIAPYGKGQAPPLWTELESQLKQLDICRIEGPPGSTVCS